MSKLPTKKPDTQANHFFAAVLASSKLEVLKLRLDLEYFHLTSPLDSIELKAMHQELAQLTA